MSELTIDQIDSVSGGLQFGWLAQAGAVALGASFGAASVGLWVGAQFFSGATSLVGIGLPVAACGVAIGYLVYKVVFSE